MTRSQFFQHFDLLADQPDAVAKMRSIVLQLAVQGRLVRQNPEDQPARDLLAQIQTASEAGGKTNDGLPPIDPTETPFQAPSGWAWTRLGRIGQTNIGLTYSPRDVSTKGIPVFRSSNVQQGRIDLTDLVRVEMEVKESALVKEGDLLICARNGSRALVGKAALIGKLTENTAFGAFMAIFRSSLNPYIYHFLSSPLFRRVIDDVNTTTINQITQNNLRNTLIPLPPLAEQRRIVAKVDELMALCDELAARQQARHAARAQLQQSALHHLTHAQTPADFRRRLDFVIRHSSFDLDDLPQLRQAILQLAVQGRLVPQNPKDEPADKLLRGIANKTKQSDGGNGSDETDWAESPHAPPFNLPASWRWARFDRIATIASNLVQPAKFASLPHVAPDNIEKGTGRLLPYRTVKEDDVRSANHRFVPGQIVYSKIRPNLSKAVVVDFEGLCSADMYPINPHINADYLLLYILSHTFLDMAVRNDTRVAMPKINQEELNRVLVAVPPLAEQKRIVARVEALLRQCDALAAQLRQTRTLGAHLLDSTLHHLLAA